MARPKKPRTIAQKTDVTHFKPVSIPLSDLDEVILHHEEIEALRLVDRENLKQEKAARKMNISRPTFQRVLSQARKKVTQALLDGEAIKVKGGDYIMTARGFGRGAGGRGRGRGGRGGRMGGPFAAGPGGVCVCTNPDCKNEVTHGAGVPCYQTKCPKCGSPMIRKR